MKPLPPAIIKEVAALRQKKFRDESGLILVEGRHPIEEALRADLTMHRFFILPARPDGLPALATPLPPEVVDERTMGRMASTDSPPPCLAVFERPGLHRQLTGELILVLDGIQDPGNLGALFRSAVGFGADMIVLAGECADPFSPKVIRASAGLVFAIPVLPCDRTAIPDLLPDRKDPGWKIYATTGHPDALHYRQADYAGRCLIILGNEGTGVSDALLTALPLQLLTIPMSARVESLNVAISGAIILSEASARRASPEVETVEASEP